MANRKFEPKTIGELLFWAYSNLAMAHVAVEDNVKKYGAKHFSIRARLFKGLQTRDMNVKSFFDDERLKMILPQACAYCGSKEHLATDHLISKKKGGKDIGENFVWACRSCNSSKSDTDMLEWAFSKQLAPSVLLYRRYLKNIITYCRQNDLLELDIESGLKKQLPFNLKLIPKNKIPLDGLKLWVTDTAKKTHYRIANWNLERPKKGSTKTNLALSKIKEISADIFVLTETSDAINIEPGFASIKSVPFERTPNEHWVTIWSKWEIVKTIDTFDPKRTACGLINSPFGKIIIYGTIIPYHMAGVNGNRYEQTGYKIWELHEEDILSQSTDWSKISSQYPDTALLVIGDFNQTRDNLPKGYGTNKGRQLLTTELNKNNLTCLTGLDFAKTNHLTIDPIKEKIRRNVDHICVSNKLLNKLDIIKIAAWNHFTDDGIYMSDHNGVYIDFCI